MKTIKLTREFEAIVDDEDFEALSKHKWYVDKGRNTYYAVRMSKYDKNNKRKKIRMHREITGCPDGYVVDHKNHNGLDNRKENLRVCKEKQNLWNQNKRSKKNKYKGYSYEHSCNKYRAAITTNGKVINLERYITEEEAAKAYDKAAIEYFGEFAKVNFK